MASPPADLPTRMRRWRRRVAGLGVGVFAGSWLAVLGLGQHGHAGASTGAAAQRPQPQQGAASAPAPQDPYSDDGGYGGSQAPDTGQGSQGSQSQPPLVTRQS